MRQQLYKFGFVGDRCWYILKIRKFPNVSVSLSSVAPPDVWALLTDVCLYNIIFGMS